MTKVKEQDSCFWLAGGAVDGAVERLALSLSHLKNMFNIPDVHAKFGWQTSR